MLVLNSLTAVEMNRHAMSLFHYASLGLACCLLMVSNLAGADVTRTSRAVTFYAMGDVPYSADDQVLLPKQLAEIPGDAEFVIHVGDIKRGFVPCLSGVYENVATTLKKSRQPLFIIPGDNEWNDCLVPVAAWKLWQQHFMRFDQNWQHRLPVFRQLEREENFSFVIDNVLFVGINLVGGRIHDADEWKQRHAQNAQWVKRNIANVGESLRAVVLFGHANPQPVHDDFFQPLTQTAQQLGKPILYLHGDGHKWIKDRPFPAQNIQRIQVDQGGIAPPLKVTIRINPEEPFLFDRRLPDAEDSVK